LFLYIHATCLTHQIFADYFEFVDRSHMDWPQLFCLDCCTSPPFVMPFCLQKSHSDDLC